MGPLSLDENLVYAANSCQLELPDQSQCSGERKLKLRDALGKPRVTREVYFLSVKLSEGECVALLSSQFD